MDHRAGLKLVSAAMAALMLLHNGLPLAVKAADIGVYRQVAELVDAAQPQVENVTVEYAEAQSETALAQDAAQPDEETSRQEPALSAGDAAQETPSPSESSAPTPETTPAATPDPTEAPLQSPEPTPAASASPAPVETPAPSATPAAGESDEAATSENAKTPDVPGLYEGGVILISSYAQLQQLASGAPLTDADGNAVLDADGAPVTYAADGQYAIVQDIELPEGGWLPPEGFTGRIDPRETAADRPLYDAASDTIYIYHTLQLAVLAQPDAGEEPVMNNDADPALFGVGQMIWPDGEEQPYLTYGAEHRYVLSTQFTTDLPKEMPGVNLMAETTPVPGTNYEGRDFPGQVVKTIGNVDYILIGNEEQLRAIGTGADVYTAVYQTDDHSYYPQWGDLLSTDDQGQPVMLYGGDTDLTEEQNGEKSYSFQQIDSVAEGHWEYVNGLRVDHVTHDRCGVNQQTGLIDTETDYDTGLNYTSDANYIIFRNIELSGGDADHSVSNWEPLMFSGTIVGATASSSADKSTLWVNPDDSMENAAGFAAVSEDGTVQPAKISNVTVIQNEKIDPEKTQGLGFFATLGSSSEVNSGVISAVGSAVVKNLYLQNITVKNQNSDVDVDWDLVGGLLAALSYLVGGLVDLLLIILSVGQIDFSFTEVITDLLNVYDVNSDVFATGAFAGKIIGDTEVENCRVIDASVTNKNSLSGGFVGYTEGVTEYSILAGIGGALVNVLEEILDIVPGLGLDTLIEVLLENALPLDTLIPKRYLPVIIKNCQVVNLNGVIGQTGTEYNGGFVGQQIGTQMTDCHVSGTYTVYADKYGGGFSGLTRDAEIMGMLEDGLGLDLVSFGQPESLLLNCTISGWAPTVATGHSVVEGGSYLGGFAGALANSYTVNCGITMAQNSALSVSGTGSYAGGWAGIGTIGWATNLGKNNQNDTTLLGGVTDLLGSLLGSGGDTSTLLSLAGVAPSAIMGCQIDGDGGVTVHVNADYAGGFVGGGDGLYITSSASTNLQNLSFWRGLEKGENLLPLPAETGRACQITNLQSVTTGGSYAGGIAGSLGGASVGGLLNSTVGLGEFLGFTVDGITLDGAYTVDAAGDYAGGAFGMAMAGEASNIAIDGITRVTARNNAGGFLGLGGPGSLATAGDGGLTINLLGLNNLISLSNVLSVIPGLQMTLTNCSVTGGEGFTVEAKGGDGSTLDDFAAGGFVGRGNSTDMTNCHVSNLLAVTAPTETAGTQGESGFAGGFVGISRNDDLADVLHTNDEGTSIGAQISVDQLLGAAPVLTPEFKNCTVQFADLAQNTTANVSADVAGGFAADFQSGTVDNSEHKNADGEPSPYAVCNITQVTGRTYAGGFAGKLYSGALANAGGGISILGGLAGLDLSKLLTVVNAYVPMVYAAGVSASGAGLAVAATDIQGENGDLNAGSAGGFAGYASGAQVSTSDVNFLRHTKVTDPAGNADAQALNTDGGSYYANAESAYAVTGGRYAGGYIGKIDIGSAASVGGGLSVLGDLLNLQNILSALNVVVTTVEHSDVYGAAGGYAVRAAAKDGNDLIGHAGGFAGTITGGHIQDSHAHNFSHIIGRESAGGYVGEMKPGDVAKLLPKGDVLNQLLNVDNILSGLQVFVPTIRNSSTDSVPCGGVVWAQAESTGAVTAGSGQTPGVQRGMAGGYVGHNEGGQIRGLDTSSWQTILSQEDENTDERKLTSVYQATYTGPTSLCKAVRICTVFGSEYAGGYTGFMESADMADAGTVSLLGGLIQADNILSALQAVYPMQENTAVYGPLADLDVDTWNSWVEFVGAGGGYGFELAQAGKVDRQEDLNAKLANYIYGYDVVAGRSAQGVNLPNAGGDAGGYVGLMRSGVLTNCMAYDVKSVQARGAAGGFAGRAEAGGAASLGGVSILGLELDLGQLVDVAELFVPVINNSSVQGYRSGMTVTATGTPSPGDDVGYAGGYVGAAYGAQIQKTDVTVDDPDVQINPANDLPKGGDIDKWAVYPDKTAADGGYADPNAAAYPTPAASCDVRNLRRVAGRSAVGGYVGLASAGSLASVNTNAGSGLLQGILDSVIGSVDDLLDLLPATVTTIYKASVSPADPDWGFVVDGAYGGGQYADYVGGFAGELQAASLGYDADSGIDQEAPGELTVTGLRQVDGGLYAGGFVGLADVNAVAEVGGNTSGGDKTTILDSLLGGLLGLGDIDAADFLRTYIYHASVDGVDEGYRVEAHTNPQKHEGTLSETRWAGCAGGFAGAVLNGTVGSSTAANVATVQAPNYTGGFVGHMGKSGVVDVDNVDLLSNLLGTTVGVVDLFGTQVQDCTVTGYAQGADTGIEVIAQGGQQPIAGGFAGYGDLGRIDRCYVGTTQPQDGASWDLTGNLKLVQSDQVAGGFIGQTDMAYLVNAEVNSWLVRLLLTIVGEILEELLALSDDQLESGDIIKINNSLLGLIEVKVLDEGNLLTLELLGLPVTISLNKNDLQANQKGVVVVTIGDSEIKLNYTADENGDPKLDFSEESSDITINLIKGNRTEIDACTVTGIANGYDVFGGKAGQTADATCQGKTGSAGGFVGYNHEGKISNSTMYYCDVVKGTAEYVGPFTGLNDLRSVYFFNNITDLEGEGNRYSIYRANDPSLVNIVTFGGKPVGEKAVTDTATGATYDRYDIDHIVDFEGIVDTDQEDAAGNKGATVQDTFKALDGAVMTNDAAATSEAPALAAYQESGAKAVLMLDTPNDPNPDTMVPEPGEGADPCLWNVDLTVNKVWDDWFDFEHERPESVRLEVIQHKYVPVEDAAGGYQEVITEEGETPQYPNTYEPIPLTEADRQSAWSAVWSTVLQDAPVVEFKDANGNGVWDGGETITAYYVYTVEEPEVPNGYEASIDNYDPADAGGYELTVTNKRTVELPNTGAAGDAMFVAVGVGLLLLGLALCRRRPRKGER